MFRDHLIVFGVTCVITSGACAQTSPVRYPITPAQVVNALATSDPIFLPEQVTLPAPLTAAVLNPALIAAGMPAVRDRELTVRVTCANRNDCLPFLVSLAFPDHNAAATAARQWQSKDQPRGVQSSPGRIVVLRAGAAATMLIDQEKVHVHLPVICLESGTVGQSIRVAASHDRSRIFTAAIVDAQSLRGTL